MDQLRERSSGTKFDTIPRQTFKVFETVLPPVNVTVSFECTANPTMELILNYLHESRALAAQAEWVAAEADYWQVLR